MMERLRPMTRSIIAIVLCMALPVSALAIEVDVSLGDVSIGDTHVQHTAAVEGGGTESRNDPHEGSVTVTGTTTQNNISVNVSAGNTVEVTLQDVNIDTSSTGEAAMDISGAGDVVVELNGTNSLTSASNHAGLETSQDGGSLTIQDEVPNEEGKTASLTAQGGQFGAGIGGGYEGSGSDIGISGGAVEATGGIGGAGIGGGQHGDGSNISISGDAQVTANGGSQGAGIGGGNTNWDGTGGDGSNISISGDAQVTANGGQFAAGIGAGNGRYSSGSNIEISGGEVTATGGDLAAGIGGGQKGNGSDIAISGGEVTATGGENGAGIGGGNKGSGEEISISGDAQVTASGSGTAADVGGGAQTTDTAKQENNVDTSGLYTTGSFTDSNGEEVKGEVVPPAPVPETPAAPAVEESALAPAPAEPFTVSEDYTKTEKDGVLTITVKGEEAELEITASGIKKLIADGIHTLVFVTDKGEIQIDLDELVKDCAATDKFVISLKGEVATITLNGEEVK